MGRGLASTFATMGLASMPAPPIAEMLRLPLVERELIAAANRRRTYSRRCISLGGLLFIYFLVQLSAIGLGSGGQMQALGMGYVFNAVLFSTCALMTGSAVLQQCTVCIAAEKEGGTLPLLLLTPLGPRRLVVQKWLSQLIDAGTLALLALPLLVVGYALGGIPLAKVAAFACALVLLILHAGALGVLASSLAATVRGAGTVALLFAVLLYAPVLIGASVLFNAIPPAVFCRPAAMLMVDLTPIGVIVMAAHATIVQYQPAWLWWVAACVLPLLPVALMLLWAGGALARWRERPAAFTSQGRLRAASGAERSLPPDQGMAWLAWKQSFLSRRLSRLGLPLVVGLLLLADLGACFDVVRANASAIALLLFALGGITLASSCAGVLPIERLRQTLEILLTTPCSAEGMVAQLHRLHRRLMRWILAVLAFALLIAAFDHGGMLDAISGSHGSGPASKPHLHRAGAGGLWPRCATAWR